METRLLPAAVNSLAGGLCCGMGIGSIESENPIPDTIKGLHCLSTTTPPLPREAYFAGQNRAGQGATGSKARAPFQSGQYLTLGGGDGIGTTGQ